MGLLRRLVEGSCGLYSSPNVFHNSISSAIPVADGNCDANGDSLAHNDPHTNPKSHTYADTLDTESLDKQYRD